MAKLRCAGLIWPLWPFREKTIEIRRRRKRENNNDPTWTPHRPYMDPTSTLHGPHIDPMKTIKIRRKRENNQNEELEEGKQ